MKSTFAAIVAAVFLLLPNGARAQNTGATLQGLVADPQHGVLPGVTVTITNVDTGLPRSLVTDATGWYRAPALPPGTYSVTAELAGFVSYERTGLTLTTGQDARVDVTLQVASVKETVVVTGETPAVDVSSNAIGTTVTRNDLDTIPLVTRNFLDLASMTPGVTGVGGGGVNTAGQLSRNNSYLVDGVSNDDTIVSASRGGFSLEAVREYVVLAGQFSAEYGISSGAIVSVVTRSGTNHHEGRAFLFNRSEKLDAQDPFSHAQGSGKAPFSQQRFGAFQGGPVARDHLFYFGSYEGLRLRQTSVVTSPLVPVDQREWPNPNDEHAAFVKFDGQMSAKHSVTARYRLDRLQTHGDGIGGLNTADRGYNSLTRDQDGVVSDTLVLSNVALNEFRLQISQRYNNIDTIGYSPDGTPAIARPSGNFGKAVNVPQGRTEDRYQLVDNFSITKGRHDLKTGTDISIIRGATFFPRTRDGSFTFSTDRPFDANDVSTYPIQYKVEHFNPHIQLPNELYAAFFQDSWRATDALTLNLGVRYDLETSYGNILGVPNDTSNLQPRIGFVWAATKDARTAVRGGFGVYADRSLLTVALDVVAAENSQTIVINSPGYPDPSSRGSLSSPLQSKTIIQPDPKTPKTESVSLGVQRQIRPALTASADVVYSRGYHLFNNIDVNYPEFVGGPRPNPEYGQIIEFAMQGNSWSTALLASMHYRPGHGPKVGLSYTLSRALRDVEDFQYFATNGLNPGADKGPANNDRTHQVVVNFNWRLPAGFQIAGLASARSGLPWTVTTGIDNNRDVNITDRPVLAVPGGDPLNPSTYNANFIGNGSLGRNTLRGADYFALDARLSKFVMLAKAQVELFAEAFNMTNYVNLAIPNGNLRSSTFGQPAALQSGAAPRRVELGFRVNF
jgi:carboxypeptidase family protein/TonB-dependent receptor-like protein